MGIVTRIHAHGLPTQKQVEMMTESFSFHWNNIYLHAITLLIVDTITRVNTVLNVDTTAECGAAAAVAEN